MSLIEEALRRVRDPLFPPRPPAPPSSHQQPRAQPAAPPAHSWSPAPPAQAPSAPGPVGINPLIAVALAVVALTAVVVIGAAFWMGRTTARSESASARDAARTERASPTPPAPAPFPKPEPFKEIPLLAIPWVKSPPAPSPQEAFVLSGVIEGAGEPYAVINGMIFGVGEQVGKATVMEIANGSVKLLLPNGKETVLRVAR